MEDATNILIFRLHSKLTATCLELGSIDDARAWVDAADGGTREIIRSSTAPHT